MRLAVEVGSGKPINHIGVLRFIPKKSWKRQAPMQHTKGMFHPSLEDRPRTYKWLVTPICKPFRPLGSGTTLLSGLTSHHGY